MFGLYLKPVVADHSSKPAKHLGLGQPLSRPTTLIPYKPLSQPGKRFQNNVLLLLFPITMSWVLICNSPVSPQYRTRHLRANSSINRAGMY
jgi:hypothetical protein